MASYSKIENPQIWESPLGANAETEEIPKTVDTAKSAELSLDYLFPHLTERPEEEGGLPPKRTAFNALFKLLGDNIYFMQQGGFYQYEANISYKRFAIVMYKGDLYQSLRADNQGHTPDSTASADYWKLLINLKSINGIEPDENGNINIDLTDIASLEEDNTFNGANTFKSVVKLAKLPSYTGTTPDASAVKDEEFPTMAAVRELVKSQGTGGGGSGDYVIKPVSVISPANNGKRVSVLLEAAGKPFNSAFEGSDPEHREYREFQITKITDGDWRNAVSLKRNSDRYALTYENRLEPRTEYMLRARDYTEWGRYSSWSETVYFTTGEDVGVTAPTVVSIEGGAEVTENPRVVCNAFSTTDGTDRHYASQWVLRTIHDNKVVYDTEEDRANLTSWTIPRGVLQENTSYELTVRYKGERYGWSAFGVHNFTTAPKFTYVETPTISVENDGLQVLGAPTFNSSIFRLITTTGAKDDHKSTSWQVVDLDKRVIWESLEDRQHLRTITMPNNLLNTGTSYRVRAMYHGYIYSSAWSEEGFITAEKFEHIAKPVLTVNGAPDNVPEAPTLQGSAFTVLPQGRATDTHVSTDWIIFNQSGNEEVWSSKNDARNLTSIAVPKSVLRTNETYLFTVAYRGKKYGISERAEVLGTTKENFTYIETPTLTVEGAPNDVREAPLLTGSAFNVVSDTGETDTHTSSHWTITKLDTGAEIYNEANDTKNLTSFRVPAGLLEPSTAYRFQVSYTGAKHGTSGKATAEATTHEVLAYINDPTLTVSGHPNKIPQTPVLSGSPFTVYSDNSTQDTHSATDWEIKSVEGETSIWTSLKDKEHLTSITVPQGKLTESTEYRFRMRYHGTNLAPTNWIEVRGTTMAAFDYIQTPTIKISAGTVSGNTDVLETPTFTSSAFTYVSSSGTVDTHQATEIKVTLAASPDSNVWTKTVQTGQGDLLSITMPKGILQLSTAYKVFIRHQGASFGWSEWASLDFSTNSTFTYIKAPVINLPGMPNNVGEQPVISGGAFTVVPSTESDTHSCSDWIIYNEGGTEEVWSSKDDSSNLTSIKVPKGKLKTSTSYKLKVRYKGENHGYSSYSELSFTTLETFSPVAMPALNVEKDEGGVYEAPLLTASSFVNTSGVSGDNHSATDWKIMKAEDRSVIWSSLSDTHNKTFIQVPNNKLEVSTSYIFAVRFQALVSGWGPWYEIVLTTQEQFYDNNAPTLLNANIDRAGTSLRFEFSTPQLHTRPEKQAATHLRVKVYNKTNSDYVDQFTTAVVSTGNYEITRVNSYEISDSDDIEYQVFYKGNSEDNDETPLSATRTRRITINENILVLLDFIQGGQFDAYMFPSFNISLNFGPQQFTHTKTDWQIKDVSNNVTVWESLQDTKHLTSIRCPKLLEAETFYTLNIKAYGTKSEAHAESKTLTTVFKTGTVSGIGTPGAAGFGVGVAPAHLLEHLGLSAMDGTTIQTSPNFGNYVDSKNNVYVFIPAFCYSFDKAEIGNEIAAKSPSAFAIKSFAEFNYNETKANEAKYILHRAFIDGGEAKEGFFITKYLVSKGNKSVKNAIAISLTSSGTDAPSKDSELNTECTGHAHDAITIAKKMTNNKGTCASGFMYSALAMLSYVHGLHAASKDNCAWYDEAGTTNYPKGCNNNALGDTDDKEILYECSDTKIAQKGNTGGANHFERTTHNGQTCGIADLNGLLEEVALGVIIHNATSNVSKFFVVKDSVSITQFTKDNVQSDNSTLYDKQSAPPSLSVSSINSGGTVYWGHATSNTFFTNQNGINRAYCGLFPAVKQTTAINEFGKDYAYAYWYSPWPAALLRCGGMWSDTASAGVFYRYLNGSGDWADSSTSWGFRAAAYGPVARIQSRAAKAATTI